MDAISSHVPAVLSNVRVRFLHADERVFEAILDGRKPRATRKRRQLPPPQRLCLPVRGQVALRQENPVRKLQKRMALAATSGARRYSNDHLGEIFE